MVASGQGQSCHATAGGLPGIGKSLGLAPERQSYEGEAAMLLEALALRAPGAGAYPYATDGEEIDPAPMFQALAEDLAKGMAHEVIAARAHGFFADAFADAALALAEVWGADTVALSGGCFQNMTLLSAITSRLRGLRIAGPGLVPANDGGLAFGQALVALTQIEAD